MTHRWQNDWEWERRHPVRYGQLVVQRDCVAWFSEPEPDPPSSPIYLYDNEGSPGAYEPGSEYVSRWRDTYASDAYRIKRSAAARASAAERKAGAEPRNPKRAR